MNPKKTERCPLANNGQTKSLCSVITTTALILCLATEIDCCVVIPREILTTVGEVVSLACNSRPNNEQYGSVSNLKFGNKDKSETVILQTPVYNANRKILTEQFVADGYFLSQLDKNLANATIQINETQLKHGGQYVCSCTPANVSTGSANLVVLEDNLSFVLNGGGNPQMTPGAMLDLSCSLSYSGSISSVSVDLTINDAAGTQLAAEVNLSLTESHGSLRVNYSFIARGNKKQSFKCEMKVWNQSSSDRRLLRSNTSDLNVSWGENITFTRDNRHSLSSSSQETMPISSVVIVLGVPVVCTSEVVALTGFLVLIVSVFFKYMYRKRDKLMLKNSTTTQHPEFGDGKHPFEQPTGSNEQPSETEADNGPRGTVATEMVRVEWPVVNHARPVMLPREKRDHPRWKDEFVERVALQRRPISDVVCTCKSNICNSLAQKNSTTTQHFGFGDWKHPFEHPTGTCKSSIWDNVVQKNSTTTQHFGFGEVLDSLGKCKVYGKLTTQQWEMVCGKLRTLHRERVCGKLRTLHWERDAKTQSDLTRCEQTMAPTNRRQKVLPEAVYGQLTTQQWEKADNFFAKITDTKTQSDLARCEQTMAPKNRGQKVLPGASGRNSTRMPGPPALLP